MVEVLLGRRESAGMSVFGIGHDVYLATNFESVKGYFRWTMYQSNYGTVWVSLSPKDGDCLPVLIN